MKISIFNLVRLCTSWLAVCTITQPGWAGYIHPTAKVHPTATIHHPEGVFIGADAEIGPNVSIYSKELYLGQYSKLENIELVEDQVWIEGFLTIKGSDNQPSLKTLYGRSKSPKIVVMLRSNRDGKHNILDEIDLDNKDKRADVFPAQNGTQVLITPHSRAKIHYDLAKFEQEKQALDTRWRQNIYKIAILSEEKKRHFSKSKYRIQIASLEAERVSINYKLDINKDNISNSKLWHSVHKHTHDKQLAAFRNQTLIDDNLRLLWKLHYHPNLDLMQALNEPDFSIKTALSLKKNQHFGIFQSGVDKILKSLTPQNFLELQLLLTHIFQEQRMDKLSLQETSDTIYMVMKKSAEKFRLDPKGLVIFKTMLKKLEQRGILSEGQRRELKVVAEQSSMSNSPYFRSLEATVEQHTRRLDAIESNVATLASHLQAVSYSVNSLRQGLEEARKVNKRIGMVQSILSVIPFASVIAETAGTYTKEALESMIDFGDALGALELVQVSGTELKELAEIKPEQIENFVNSKLESIEEKYRLNAHQDMQHLATDIPLIAAASQSPAFTKANAAEGKDMLKKHLLGTAFLPAYAKAMDGEANYQRAISYLQQNPAGNKNHSDYYNGTYQEAVSQNVVTQEITNQNITSTEVKSQNVVTQEIVKQTNPAPKRTYQYRPLTFNEKAIITAWLFLVGALVSHMMY